MLTEPLPSMLDVRKAAARGVSVSGTLRPLELMRFQPLLAADEGTIEAQLSFSRDEENRYVIHVAVEADVSVTCQRCLEPMPAHLTSDNTLAVVWTDEQVAHLPRHLDPLIVAQEACNLWELVEDELILAMPPFSYHDTQECKERIAGFSDAAPEGSAAEDKPNPFNVLAQLKPGNKR
ncbi:MAG: hypothetical protein DRQ98_14305 [Gammaproteobacteria bacterium]|nr:MAG: hypothetical protein DRQ98_14305 [Gammaproteobacteria bacterium]